ncbi:MAG: 50S ribosomal protein L29 [Kiritimatiellia bacterium]
MKNIKQVRETSTEELKAQVAELGKQILEMRVKKTASDVASNPVKRRILRRKAARMLTVIRERELQENK